MVKNYYYLIVGVLFVLFSFSHAWNGQTNFLPAIDSSSLPLATRTTIFYVWHIITAENLIFGIAFLVMSFYEDSSKVRFTALTVASISLAASGRSRISAEPASPLTTFLVRRRRRPIGRCPTPPWRKRFTLPSTAQFFLPNRGSATEACCGLIPEVRPRGSDCPASPPALP